MKENQKKWIFVEVVTVASLAILIVFLMFPFVFRPGLSHVIVTKRNFVRSELKLLENSLNLYMLDYGKFPPNKNSDTNTNEEGEVFLYRSDILVKYLGGAKFNPKEVMGLNKKTYFDFDEKRIKNNIVYEDVFGEPIWYHNFKEDDLKQMQTDAENPLHPWTNAINHKSIQLYSKVNIGINPYYNNVKKVENFFWITNYLKNDPYNKKILAKYDTYQLVFTCIFWFLLLAGIIIFLKNKNK